MEALQGVIFDSHDETFRCPQGAVPCGQLLTLRVLVSRGSGVTGLSLRLWADNAERILPMEKGRFYRHTPYGDYLDEYVVNVSRETLGLVWYQFLIFTDGSCYYGGCDADHLGGKVVIYDHPEPVRSFQITLTEPGFSVPDWAKGAIMYQIFPDRFYSAAGYGDPTGKKMHAHWDEAPEYRPDPEKGYYAADDFFGGNLRGIEEKLPYLASLHVEILYLNPIFKAYANHRYDTGDYETVDPLLGTAEELAHLCTEAKKLGIRVILDGVFSHTGSDSRYFNREGRYPTVGAYQSPDSPYASWYSFENFPDKYDCWWGVWSLPCVKETDPSYEAYILTDKNSVIRRWMAAGVSGWRLDVADELPDEFLKVLRREVKSTDPDALVLGEVWEDASSKISYDVQREFLYGRELDTVMNYPLKNAVVDLLTGEIDAAGFVKRVFSLRENYPPDTFACLMNFLSTHDLERITTRLTGSTEGLSREEQAAYLPDDASLLVAKALHKLGALILYSLPGMPCIYYGDEAGLTGCRDPFNRGTYPWGREDQELLAWYRALGDLRDEVMKQGRLSMDAAGSLLGIRRVLADQWRVTLINVSDETVETLVDLSYFRSEPRVLLDSGCGMQFSPRENGWYLLLPPRSGVVFGN